jgi:hypothetical protein
VVIGVNLHYGDSEKTGCGNRSENQPGKRLRRYTYTDAEIAPRRAAPMVFARETFILARF